MDCKQCKENLICYIEGLMDQQQRLAIEEHLNTCHECKIEADETAKLHKLLIIQGEKISENVFLEEKVLEQIYIEKSQAASHSHIAGVALSIRHLRKNLVKYLVAASVAITLILGIHLLGNSTVEANVAWARVADDIINAETATFDVTLGGGPIMKNIMNGQYRKQIFGNGFECIADRDTGHILILNSEKKAAYFAESANMINYSNNCLQYLRDKIEILKASPKTKVVALGIRNIDNRITKGVHVYNNNIDLKIWTGIEDNLPALIAYDRVIGLPAFRMSNFKFNVPVEELAFNMNVPQEYTLELLAIDFGKTTEQDLIEALNIWVNVYLDGHFPDKFNALELHTQTKIINKKNKELGITKKEELEMSIQITRGFLFIQNLDPDSDQQYTGIGATTDDTESIIFRYKPHGSETYRVIYGDLSVGDANLTN